MGVPDDRTVAFQQMAIGAAGGVRADFAEIQRFQKLFCRGPRRQTRLSQNVKRGRIHQQQTEAGQIAADSHDPSFCVEHQRREHAAEYVQRF